MYRLATPEPPSIAEEAQKAAEPILDRHLEEAQSHPDPMYASIGVINNQLMRLATVYFGAIHSEMEDGRDDPYVLDAMTPHINLYLKMVKQIEGFTRLEKSGRKARGPARKNKKLTAVTPVIDVTSRSVN